MLRLGRATYLSDISIRLDRATYLLNKAKFKMELEALARILRLNWHFRMKKMCLIWIRLSQNLLSIRVIKMQQSKYT